MNITLKETLINIRSDKEKYSNWKKSAGFWVTFSYRIRRLRKFGNAFCKLLIPFDVFLGIIKTIVSDTTIPSDIEVGKGLFLPHPNGIILNNRVKIGENVSIFQQVTLGEWHDGFPQIGDNCAIFAGAKIFGNIKIGNNSKIGANCVVSTDINENSTVYLDSIKIKIKTQETM